MCTIAARDLREADCGAAKVGGGHACVAVPGPFARLAATARVVPTGSEEKTDERSQNGNDDSLN
jgi:hypothetical protein